MVRTLRGQARCESLRRSGRPLSRLLSRNHHGRMFRRDLSQKPASADSRARRSGKPSVAAIEAARDLRLAALHGPGLARLGVTAELASGADFAVSQAWSRALWERPDAPDGVVYRSRHDDSALCVAIYHRAKTALTIVEDRRLTDDPKLLARLIRKYNLGLTR